MELQEIRSFLSIAWGSPVLAGDAALVDGHRHSLERLEREMGGPLVREGHAGKELTTLGHEVLPLLEKLFMAASAAGFNKVASDVPCVAPFVIALASGMSPAVLSKPIAEVARLVKGLAIKVVSADFDDICLMLGSGLANAAVIRGDHAIPAQLNHWALFDDVTLLAPRQRGYEPTLDAFTKTARLQDWAANPLPQAISGGIVPQPVTQFSSSRNGGQSARNRATVAAQ